MANNFPIVGSAGVPASGVLTVQGASANGTAIPVSISESNIINIAQSSETVDAFGRLRVSEPVNLFNCQFQFDTQPLLFQTSVSGGGSVTKTSGQSSLTLSTGGGTSGATAINQTKQYSRYQPAKSTQVFMTGVLGVQKTNVQSKIGFYDANDGVFFQQDGTAGASVNQRSSTSGAPVTTSTTQANWNIDVMDGSGSTSNPSGFLVDWSKTQIFTIDLQWLGVGRVRFGLVIDGIAYYVHQQFNANRITVPYMNTANLPCRAEITNTGVASGATTMTQICISVASEGGSNLPTGYTFTGGTGSNQVALGSSLVPVASMRPAATFNSITNRAQIILTDLDIVNVSSASVYWQLIYNPATLTTPSFAAANASSCVQIDTSATAYTGGLVIDSGYIGGSQRYNVVIPENQLLPFTLDMAGTTPDVYTLVAQQLGTGSNPSISMAYNWVENR